MTATLERPADIDSIVGQTALVNRLKIVMAGARIRGTKAPHVLLSGPAGTGKTTLARIVAHELGAALLVTSGPVLRRPADLAGLMFSMDPKKPAVLFIDEIHRMPMVVEETLYEALEDGTLSVIVGSSNDARSVTLRLPPLVIVGATTKPGALSQPLRDRFGFNAATAPYTDEELAEIVLREWTRNGRESADGAALVVGQRAKGVPRLALHLASRVMDVTAIEHTEITAETAERALEAFGVGRDGLDELDWRVLTALCVTFSGRAVGLDALAQALDVDQHTISATCEGNLVRKGLMMRTKGGRQAAPAAYELVRGMSA